MPQPNWIKSAWGWASTIPHNFTAPASRGLPESRLTGNPPFPDVDTNHWASDYIQTLANLRIISGFPDGSFRPDAPVTRAQFAAILRNAFPSNDVDLRQVTPFNDVAPSYWANIAIRTARATGFLAGYPGNRFRPEQKIPRVQALVALTNGLNYASQRFNRESERETLAYYQDSDKIPNYAISSLAAATDLSLVVNHPNLRQLNPNNNASRAEIAAFVYQALLQEGKAAPLATNPFRVVATTFPWETQPERTIPVQAKQLSFNGPGTRLATLNSAANLIQVWDSETGTLLSEMNAMSRARFEAIALSEDGETLFAIAQNLPNHSLSLQAWDITISPHTREPIWQQPLGDASENIANTTQFIDIPLPQLAVRPRHGEVLTQVSLVPQATEATDIKLRLHNPETGEVQSNLISSPGIALQQVCFSAKGDYLAALGQVIAGSSNTKQQIDLWQLSTGDHLPSLSPTHNFLSSDPAFIYFDIAFTPNGTLRTIAQNLADIRLDTWNVLTGERLEQITQLPTIDRQDRLGRLSPDGISYFVHSDVIGSRLINTQLGSVIPLDVLVGQTIFSGKGDHLAIASPADPGITHQSTVSLFSQAPPQR